MRDTANAIALALFDLMEDSRYEKISVAAIARAAHCDRSTFYRHFETKDDVVRHRVMMAMGGTLEEFISPRSRTFEGYLRELFESMRENQRVFELIRRNRLNDHLIDGIEQLFAVEYDAAKLSVPDQYALAFHIGGIASHVRLWVSRGMVDSPDELVEYTKGTFADGFVPMRVRLLARARQDEGADAESR